jgi:F420-dependent oxidoreductase-like protein
LLLLLLPGLASAASEGVRFGVQVAPEGVSYEKVAETFRLIEALGYDSGWLNDHLLTSVGDEDDSQLESWMTLAALATETQRLRLGILVTSNTFRHPVLLAKMAVTVDHISDGRLNLGIGAGWQEREHEAYGVPFHSAKRRAERLAEALELISGLWGADHPSLDGKEYRLDRAPFAPRPVQRPHPPIVVGGQGKKWIMPTVARYADHWTVPVGIGPQGVAERLQIIREECRRIGREPCVQKVSAFLPLANITAVPFAGPVTRLGARLLYGTEAATSVLAGSVGEIREKIQTYVDVGVTEVIITTRPALNHELMRRFATEVMPTFQGLQEGAE